MKKINLMLAITSISTMLIAGGDISPVPEDAKIAPICDSNKVFVQHDKKLMWQDMKYTDKENWGYKKNKTSGKVGGAFYAKRYCQNLNYKGYSDWRLPTSEELMSLYSPIEDSPEFNPKDNYWSSTPAETGKAYVVYSADGFRYAKKTRESYYIRCVRCDK